MVLKDKDITDLLQRLNNVSVPNIADAMDHLDMECRWLSKKFESINTGRFSGLADTVEWGPTRKSKDLLAPGKSTWEEVGNFVSSIESSKIPRVYVSGSTYSSSNYVLAGGLTINYLKHTGYVGAILNGALRDLEEIENIDFPVWYENKGVMDSQGCMKVIGRGDGCTVNGFKVSQDDVVTGDKNGVVCISSDKLEGVIQTAESISEKESIVLKNIKNGKDLFELISQGGHI